MSGELGTGRKLVAGRSIRWNEARARDAYAEGWWGRETLADALARAASETPRRCLLVDGLNKVDAFTLHRRATQLAKAMLIRYAPGSVVSFMLPNWHEAAEIYLGATLAGMVVNPLLPSLRDYDLSFILKDVQSRVVFAPSSFKGFDYGAMMGRVAAGLDDAPDVVLLRGVSGPWTPYESLFRSVDGPDLPKLDPEAVRMVMYTSGTTGRPKGVLHSHNSIHALIQQIGIHWRVRPGDSFLVPSPISHIGGSIYAFESPLLLKSRAVLMEKWDADAAVGLIEAEKCTHMAGATPFLEQLLEASKRAGTQLPSLKLFICGGASVSPSLIRSAAEQLKATAVTRVYGSTEVPVTTIGVPDRADLDHAAETDGHWGIADVRLSDSSGAESEAGEILACGPQMFVGYHRIEDEADSFDADGYYRTGDLGRRVDANYLVVTGRAKDLIIRHGENISPKEVEDALAGHPAIAEIAVVGLPDPRTGERACAVIVPASRPGPDVDSLRLFLEKQGFAKFKMPEQVEIWEALPKNDAGKVLKHEIRQTLSAAAP